MPTSPARERTTRSSPTGSRSASTWRTCATPDVRERLVRIWTDPLSLDPARKSARVTRAIAERLAAVSKALEAQQHPPEDVAMFLMRCLFTMFAEDVGLLPKASFRDLLERCEQDPDRLAADGGPALGGDGPRRLRHRHRGAGEALQRRVLQDAHRAAAARARRSANCARRRRMTGATSIRRSSARCWNRRSIRAERRRLGAHYTPRAYVERLVVATIIEPLRADWDRALSTAERQKSEGRMKDAVATIAAFHETLCTTRDSRSGLRHRQFPVCVAGTAEAAGRRGAGGAGRPRRAGGVARAGGTHGRSAPVPRAGDQPARRGDRRTGAVDRLSAMAFAHAERLAVGADPEGVPQHRGEGRGAGGEGHRWCGTRAASR